MTWLRPTVTELLSRGAPEEAMRLVDHALTEQPEEPALLQKRAEILGRLGRREEACRVLVELADHLTGRGFGRGAAAALEQASAIDPEASGIAERLPTLAALLHLDAVSASPLFEMFSRDELVGVVRQLEVRSYEAGEILLVEGKPGDSLFVIASGQVRIYEQGEDGWPSQLGLLQAPQFYGEIAVLDGGVRTATVVAASQVHVLVLGSEGLAHLVRAKPRVAEVLRSFADERRPQKHLPGA